MRFERAKVVQIERKTKKNHIFLGFSEMQPTLTFGQRYEIFMNYELLTFTPLLSLPLYAVPLMQRNPSGAVQTTQSDSFYAPQD